MCGIPTFLGAECKAKWKSLRESYRKAIKNRKTKSGQEAKKIRAWRYESEIEFVRPFIEYQSDDHASNLETLSPVSAATCEDSQTSDNTASQVYSPPPQGNSVAGPSRSPKRKSTHASSQAADVFRDYINFKKANVTNSKPDDHLRKYFSSIEETVRNFPPHIQIQVKSDISSVVHKAEFEAMNYNNSQMSMLQSPTTAPIHFPYAYSNVASQLQATYSATIPPNIQTNSQVMPASLSQRPDYHPEFTSTHSMSHTVCSGQSSPSSPIQLPPHS